MARTSALVVLMATALVTACAGLGDAGTTEPAGPDGSAPPATASPVPAPAVRVEGGGNLGTNVGGVNYWDGVVPFADLMDQAGDWVPQADGLPWGEGPPLTFDEHGWPTDLQPGQYASTLLAEVTYPAGTYTVSWSGSGEFDVNGTGFGGAASGGTGSLELDGGTSVVLNLRANDAADPIRDIDIRLPGEDAEAVFRSAYLDQLAPYRALRFMDWQRTNSVPGDPERSFTCAERVTDRHYSQGSLLGVSVERMVDLANAVQADPWFTIPHTATDDWITCHAEVVAARLDPQLTPRYEFSNETWNPVFSAYHDLAADAAARGLGADEFEGIQLLTGERHAEVMRLVDDVFSSAGRPIVRVLSGQAANSWVAETRLAASGARERTDAIAIAPYLSLPGSPTDPAESAALAASTPEEVIALLDEALERDVATWMADHLALAERAQVPLITYEGGQHLAGDPSNDAVTELFTSLNRSEAMGGLYGRYLDAWATATGNALFMHFSDIGPASRFGSWGALERWDADTSPKYAALVAFASTPRP